MRFDLQLKRGADRGQNFGSLFEVPTVDGSVIGAGFQGVYNTYHRTDRHVLQFFMRPGSGPRSFETQTLPRSTDLAGTYLFDLDGAVFSSSEDVRRWDVSSQDWVADPSDARERMRLGSSLLSFSGGSATCDGVPLLSAPDKGLYHHFFYAHGHLFFYHTYWAQQSEARLHTTDGEGFSKLYACPWSPDSGRVDLTKARVITLPVVGEVPFSYGQYKQEVLTCSNIGGVYVFDGESWRTIVAPDIDTSYQVYSMINFYDRLLLAQYPTGQLFEYAGTEVSLISGWPPVMAGASTQAREAQTLAIYGGELYVGVWPWGELWRLNPDSSEWIFVRRMMSQPPVTDTTNHPYEQEAAAAGLVFNQWGQRVTSLVPNGAGMFISTSAKAPTLWEPAFDFVGDEKWKEYGTVTCLTVPDVISTPIHWTEGETHLEFIIDQETMSIQQDDRLLAEVAIESSSVTGPEVVVAQSLTWGRGIFGAYGGEALEGRLL